MGRPGRRGERLGSAGGAVLLLGEVLADVAGSEPRLFGNKDHLESPANILEVSGNFSELVKSRICAEKPSTPEYNNKQQNVN